MKVPKGLVGTGATVSAAANGQTVIALAVMVVVAMVLLFLSVRDVDARRTTNLLTDDSEGLRFQPDTSGLGNAITGQRVAYQRVSSLDQRVDRQLDGITVRRTFTDTVSGRDTHRLQLEAMLGFVRRGDTVIVHSMDRLARNLEDLRRIVRELTAKGVRVQFLTALSRAGANVPGTEVITAPPPVRSSRCAPVEQFRLRSTSLSTHWRDVYPTG